MISTAKKAVLAVMALASPMMASAQSDTFKPEDSFKAVAEIPMHLLLIARISMTVLSVLLFVYALWHMGVRALKESKANSYFSSRIDLSPAQTFTTLMLSIFLYTVSSSMGYFGVTAGILKGEGDTKIQHPVALANAGDVDFVQQVLKAFTFNTMYLLAFIWLVRAILLWKDINEGRRNDSFFKVFWMMVASALAFSSEVVYYFLIATLEFPDFLDIIFKSI